MCEMPGGAAVPSRKRNRQHDECKMVLYHRYRCRGAFDCEIRRRPPGAGWRRKIKWRQYIIPRRQVHRKKSIPVRLQVRDRLAAAGNRHGPSGQRAQTAHVSNNA